MARKSNPIVFDKFNGLWVRGPVDKTPRDHFSDCLNTIYADAEVGTRDGTSEYLGIDNIVYMALYKPNPVGGSFSGTNVPRIIALNNVGELYDVLLSTSVPIYTNADMTSFGFANFFGRCYISPSNGRTGLENEKLKVYDGTTFRNAGGSTPTVPMVVSLGATPGNCDPGTYILSYAFETSTGFITRPAVPFTYIDLFGATSIDVDTLPIGPSGTVARWIISTKAIIRESLASPPNVAEAEFLPLYFVTRIGNNVDTTANLSFFDEQLIDEANYLFTQLEEIPAGVGLLDYKGRLVSYGEFDDPSLVRVSEPGEPEAFSETSGFLITDPADNTGVRCCTEFRSTLHVYKQSRGYITEDNGEEASTWQVINFEKSIGTEPNGIADILDAKGSSSEGFILCSLGAIYFFNGVFLEPELSYKIRDLWKGRINEEVFYLIQAVNDPINKRLYILVPLDGAEELSHIIYGDYRNGLDATNIKWSIWQFDEAPTSLLAYTDFTDNVPNLVTRISFTSNIRTLNINTPSNDDGAAVDSHATLAPTRSSYGISQFERARFTITGPADVALTVYGIDNVKSANLTTLSVPLAPGREYAQLMNFISEQMQLKFRCNTLNQMYKINNIAIDASEYSDEHPR